MRAVHHRSFSCFRILWQSVLHSFLPVLRVPANNTAQVLDQQCTGHPVPSGSLVATTRSLDMSLLSLFLSRVLHSAEELSSTASCTYRQRVAGRRSSGKSQLAVGAHASKQTCVGGTLSLGTRRPALAQPATRAIITDALGSAHSTGGPQAPSTVPVGVTTETRHLDWLGQLGECEQDSNTDSSSGGRTPKQCPTA